MRWHPLSLDLQGALLHMCSQEGLLNFKNEDYVVGRVNGSLQEGLRQRGPSRTTAASVPVPVVDPC